MNLRQYSYTCFALLICLFFGREGSQAQSVFRDIPDLPFINTDASAVYFPTDDTTVYDKLFRKLDRLLLEGKGKVNILHIGGSHIQSGTLSHQIRSDLLNAFPGTTGDRGLIFPFSAAKTNNPQNYKTTYSGDWLTVKNTQRNPGYPLGLTGMCITTSDTNATIGIRMRNTADLAFDFNKVYLLGNCDTGDVRPLLHIRDSIIIEGVYDTLLSVYCFELGMYVDEFVLSFATNDTLGWTFSLRGFWLSNGLPGITYTDVGVNGANVSSYLKCVYLEQDLAIVKPDLCIFSVGINDASGTNFDTSYFMNNYKALIRRIRTVAPDCAILFTTNNDSYQKVNKRYYNNTNGLLARQAFYSLAAFYNTGVWDLFSWMGGLEAIKQWENKNLAQKDKVHFTAQGYSLIGDCIYNAFISEYIKYLYKSSAHGLE
ncbi:MAG: GDSL-type esterase/lipase family protein [Bacteroidales bacterium]|jgi:lysophospholipase L1-like esterase|nr:GDSL-type esterase/lipase family protein [Bacteroidales bacterium]